MPVKKGYKGDYKKVMTELKKNFRIVQRKRDWNIYFYEHKYDYIPWDDSALVRAYIKRRINDRNSYEQHTFSNYISRNIRIALVGEDNRI